MTTFPLNLVDKMGHWESYIVYMIIGFAFGFVLEMAGFGNSKKLAAQFYFKDLTVLKVMFTGIVVAMILIFLATGVGLLDYNRIWVNPTYLIPGIVGGLIMGFGFIIGGFCPGTSLVAAATLKIDGLFFALGVLFGIFIFGESVGNFEGFFNSTEMGRYTLPEFLGLNTGVVVLGVLVMALAAFFAGEYAEQFFGSKPRSEAPRWRYSAAGVSMMAAVAVIFIGQPNTLDRWNRVKDEKQAQIDNREVQIHPAELLATMHNDRLLTYMIDVRQESDYNQFHILDAVHIAPDDIQEAIPDLLEEPGNTVFVVMSNDEKQATQVWKTLIAEGVANVYILEGGLNNWIATYADTDFKTENILLDHADDQLGYHFASALGWRYLFANPSPEAFEIEYTPKIQLKAKGGGGKGGCG